MAFDFNSDHLFSMRLWRKFAITISTDEPNEQYFNDVKMKDDREKQKHETKSIKNHMETVFSDFFVQFLDFQTEIVRLCVRITVATLRYLSEKKSRFYAILCFRWQHFIRRRWNGNFAGNSKRRSLQSNMNWIANFPQFPADLMKRQAQLSQQAHNFLHSDVVVISRRHSNSRLNFHGTRKMVWKFDMRFGTA